jgi:hypothetical protein
MTPKEKAKKLFDYHYFYARNNQDRRYVSMQCALITVNEIIDVLDKSCFELKEYYHQVKIELIKKL